MVLSLTVVKINETALVSGRKNTPLLQADNEEWSNLG